MDDPWTPLERTIPGYQRPEWVRKAEAVAKERARREQAEANWRRVMARWHDDPGDEVHQIVNGCGEVIQEIRTPLAQG